MNVVIGNSEPIIIVGCHRSGTSILSKILHHSGLWMGGDLNSHSESVEFLKINELVFHEFGASWSNPDNLINSLESNFESVWQVFEKGLSDFHKPAYISWFSEKKLILGKRNWGWKEPRTTITFPLWIRLFPSAKIINIQRHGFDVALSIQKREKKRDKSSYLYDPKLEDFNESFKLWLKYNTWIDKQLESVPKENTIAFHYEDFINGDFEINQLSEFLSLDLSKKFKKLIKPKSSMNFEKVRKDIYQNNLDQRGLTYLNSIGYGQ